MKYKIKELGKTITGTTPSTKNSDYYSSADVMFVSPTDIKSQRYIKNTEKHISNNAFNDFKSRHLDSNDIIVDCIGSDMGDVAIIMQKCMTNQQINAITQIDNDKVLPLYLYYLLSTKKSYFHLIGSNGSTMPIISKSLFDEIELSLHDLDFQQHIVDTIGSVDDLIEKNSLIFKNFQLLLSQKYKELENVIKTKVPLKKYITKSGALLKNNEWIDSNVIDLSSMPQDEISITSSSKGEEFSTNIKTLTKDSLLYGSIRPYFKKCGFCVDEKYVAGTVHSFNVNNSSYLLWILATICSANFHKYTESNSQGTKMPIINWETFCNYNLPIPSQEQLEEFNFTMLPMFNLVKTKMRESKKLKQQKDLLLKKYFG